MVSNHVELGELAEQHNVPFKMMGMGDDDAASSSLLASRRAAAEDAARATLDDYEVSS